MAQSFARAYICTDLAHKKAWGVQYCFGILGADHHLTAGQSPVLLPRRCYSCNNLSYAAAVAKRERFKRSGNAKTRIATPLERPISQPTSEW
jgi:hypothetical protein